MSFDITQLKARLPAMSNSEFSQLSELITKERKRRIRECERLFGDIFCKKVDVKLLYKLPKVTARDLSLENDPIIPEEIVKPSMLNGYPAVWGVTRSNRTFLAIKIYLIDKETQKIIGTVVELFIQLRAEDHASYITAKKNLSNKKKSFTSCFGKRGSLGDREMEAIKKLLQGKKIEAPTRDYQIQMVEEKSSIPSNGIQH